jgi:hypothetical protein
MRNPAPPPRSIPAHWSGRDLQIEPLRQVLAATGEPGLYRSIVLVPLVPSPTGHGRATPSVVCQDRFVHQQTGPAEGRFWGLGTTHLPAMSAIYIRPTSLSPYLLVVHKATAELCAVGQSRGERTWARRVLETSKAESRFILGLEILRSWHVAQGRRGPRLMTRRFSIDVGRLDSGHGLGCRHPQHSVCKG